MALYHDTPFDLPTPHSGFAGQPPLPTTASVELAALYRCAERIFNSEPVDNTKCIDDPQGLVAQAQKQGDTKTCSTVTMGPWRGGSGLWPLPSLHRASCRAARKPVARTR